MWHRPGGCIITVELTEKRAAGRGRQEDRRQVALRPNFKGRGQPLSYRYWQRRHFKSLLVPPPPPPPTPTPTNFEAGRNCGMANARKSDRTPHKIPGIRRGGGDTCRWPSHTGRTVSCPVYKVYRHMTGRGLPKGWATYTVDSPHFPTADGQPIQYNIPR